MWSFYLLENEDNTEESRAEKKDEQIPGTVWLSWIQLYLKLTLGLSNTVPLGGLQFTMASVYSLFAQMLHMLAAAYASVTNKLFW